MDRNSPTQPNLRFDLIANKQRGMALITVLFVVALGVIVAVEMAVRLQLQVSRTTNILGDRQAYWYAISAEELAKQQLQRINSEENNRSEAIHSGQDWAQKGLEFPVEGGSIGGELNDLQACFNLNALAADGTDGKKNTTNTGNNMSPVDIPSKGDGQKKANDNQNEPPKPGGASTSGGRSENPNRRRGITYPMEVFQRLLEVLEVDQIAEVPPEYLMQRLKDWLDNDGMQTGGGGMEEDDYRGLKIPYLAANTLMASFSELRMVGGFNPAVMAKIKPYVCVIPGNSQLKVNINTLDAEQGELLSAMLDGVTVEDAQALISGGQPDGYQNIGELWERSEVNRLDDKIKDEAAEYLTVTTEYFALKAHSTYGDSKFYLNSKLHISESKKVTVIARRFGVDW